MEQYSPFATSNIFLFLAISGLGSKIQGKKGGEKKNMFCEGKLSKLKPVKTGVLVT